MSDYVSNNSVPPVIPGDIQNTCGQFNSDVKIVGNLRAGSTSTALLSFYGVTGATQARTTIATGAWVGVASSTCVGISDTFSGYTIGQVVVALKNVGILG